MENIKKYIVVSQITSRELEVMVNRQIEKGYVPQGGIQYTAGKGYLNGNFNQAMVLADLKIKD
tara:strand:+ start:2090 stop:2278 length:189 start_codon:yes stop_codon:yes gene_type:complete